MPAEVVPTRLVDGELWSNVVRAGDLLFIGGLVSIDPVTQQPVGETIQEQSRQVLDLLRFAVVDAGGELSDVVKVNIFMRDWEQVGEFNAVYGEFFSGSAPARTAVQAGRLGRRFLVEIEAVAHVPSTPAPTR